MENTIFDFYLIRAAFNVSVFLHPVESLDGILQSHPPLQMRLTVPGELLLMRRATTFAFFAATSLGTLQIISYANALDGLKIASS